MSLPDGKNISNESASNDCIRKGYASHSTSLVNFLLVCQKYK